MNRNWPQFVLMFGICCTLVVSAIRANAFALLGPYESWMEETNDFRQPGDIGGPMDIGSGYRWNVPVVTYGFDKSFLDFFGTNGVAAVESAIQVFNDLPPASQIVLTNYPLNSASVNYQAQAGNLCDLKSATLVLILEQMGLTQPMRYIFTLKQWDPIFITHETEGSWWAGTNWLDEIIPNDIVLRNFDPETLTSSFYVNGALFSGYVISGEEDYYGQVNNALPIPVDPLYVNQSVADYALNIGWYTGGFTIGNFFTGLTEDDVGGLCYLLSTNNVAYETLLPNVFGTGTNASSFVNGAWRPGVDKITFVPQPFDSVHCQFLPMTNQFTDTYVTNGNITQQQLQRVVTQPDFIFCAGDVNYGVLGIPFVDRTGTTNWINNAALNGNPTNGGPGVIQPQIKIIFNKLGPRLINLNDTSAQESSIYWSTFDGSTNPPIIYPISQTGTNQFTIRMWLIMGDFPNQFQKNFDWSLTNSTGSVSLFQTSANLTDWVTDFSVTNDGSVWTFENSNPLSTYRFYRVVPQ
jgi:hypothetical protein